MHFAIDLFYDKLVKKIFLFLAFLFLLLFFFSSFSSKPAQAAGTCSASTCTGYTACACNLGNCLAKKNTCSNSTSVCGGASKTPCCVAEWAGAQTCPQVACNGGAGCGATCTTGDRRCTGENTYQVCTSGVWDSTNLTCPTAGTVCVTLTTSPYASCKLPPGGGGGGYDCVANLGGKCAPICSSPISGATGCNTSLHEVCCSYSSGAGGCPVCTSPDYYDPYTGKCAYFRDSAPGNGMTYSIPTYQNCDTSIGQVCKPGCGCNCTLPKGFTSGSLPCGADGKTCYTAFGNINLDPASLVKAFFGIVLSISGGIAVLLIILSGYRLIASQGNPEKIREAQEHLTAAIIGLLFVIFSFAILRFIGVDVLGIFP